MGRQVVGNFNKSLYLVLPVMIFPITVIIAFPLRARPAMCTWDLSPHRVRKSILLLS
jgi:hypothetical protein